MVTVPRQSGKTTLVAPIAAHRCLTGTDRRCWYTAQTRADARDAWTDVVRLLQRSPLAPRVKVRESNGSEAVTFPTGSTYRIFSPSEDALHGKANALVALDEAWAVDPIRGDALVQAIVPTFTTTDGQLWIFSTAGTADSTWFRSYVDRGRTAVDAGHTDTLAYFEWSIADGVDPGRPMGMRRFSESGCTSGTTLWMTHSVPTARFDPGRPLAPRPRSAKLPNNLTVGPLADQSGSSSVASVGVHGESWVWDETLYAGSAAFYTMGRLPYPAALADAVRRELQTDGGGRLLDVGCGPGSLTLLLAPLFEAAVGIDADPDMISEARREAARRRVRNVGWRQLRAEDLPAGMGRFRVVTFAQSFHWMNRPLVAGRVRRMLIADGAWVHVHATTHQGVAGEDRLPHPRPPWDAIDGLITEYLGPVRRAGQAALPTGTPSGEDQVMRDAGFTGPVRVEVGGGDVVTRTADEVVASVFSLSRAAPHLFGDRIPAFDGGIRRLLWQASPKGLFAERTRETALDFWRP